MTMPTWEQLMAPVLRALGDGETRHKREIYDRVASAEKITEEQRATLLNSGQSRYENRVGWAVSFLTRVGALERPSRAHYRVTDDGRKLLHRHPAGISEEDLLELIEEDVAPWRTRTVPVDDSSVPPVPAISRNREVLDPMEQIAQAVERLEEEVAADLLDRLWGREPAFFERTVVKLLVAMGYGGAGGEERVTQLTNDGGIDGIIDRDALGLNRVYIQAKRYALDTPVGRPELQSFVGALSGKADGGVFITTGRFSAGALEYARNVPLRIVPVDGKRLAALMIRYGVGVQTKQEVKVVEIDEDFFE